MKPSAFTSAPFVGVDGEGFTMRDRHDYGFLASSDGAELWKPTGISTQDALGWLAGLGRRHPGAIFVCFGASYDVNMMVRDLPRDDLLQLWKGRRVTFGKYEIEYRARKSFTVREWGTPRFVRVTSKGKRTWAPYFASMMVLWDVYGFFQSSFLEAIEKNLGRDYPGLAIIRKGKARRSQFKPSERADIETYTREELKALVALMNDLRTNLRDADLPVARWDGAGAIAASLLRREGVKDALTEPPREVRTAAQAAYSGGRMEVWRFGRHMGPVFHYDINSAYPTAACELPSLAGAEWTSVETKELSSEPFTLVYVKWSLRMRDGRAVECFPFFYREPDTSICYPPEGEGWHWQSEVLAALDGLDRGVYAGRINIEYQWRIVSPTRARPFSFIPELFAQRAAWKAEGRGAEKVMKLAINSLYGKLAQQSGWSASRRPPYHSLVWAGYITAHTRSAILTAAMQKPRDVIMSATDGIYVTAPLDLPTGTKLGEWSAHKHEGILVAQSGVYYVYDKPNDTHRHRSGCTSGLCEYEYRRGFDEGSLSSESITDAWRRGRSYCERGTDHRPMGLHVDARATRFVTMGSALSGDEQFKHWRQWRTVPRALTLSPAGTKRELAPHTGRVRPDLGLVTTIARVPVSQGPSLPYPLAWVDGRSDVGEVDGVSATTFALEHAESAS